MTQKVSLGMTDGVEAKITSEIVELEASLGTAATRDVGNTKGGVYARGDISGEIVFDNPNGQTSVSYSELSDSSDGWYVVQHAGVWTMIYIGEDYTSDEYSVMSKLILTTSAPFVMTFRTIRIFGTSISSLIQEYDVTNATANSYLSYIFKIIKV